MPAGRSGSESATGPWKCIATASASPPTPAERKHEIITLHEHHHGIPLGAARSGGKILVHLRETAPAVETRSLAAYESVAMGGA